MIHKRYVIQAAHNVLIGASMFACRYMVGCNFRNTFDALHNNNLLIPTCSHSELATCGLKIGRSSCCGSCGMSRVICDKRIDDWLNVPNSNVNDNGEPNLNNSDAENDNDARVLVRIKVLLADTFTPAANLAARFGEFGLQFQCVGVIY